MTVAEAILELETLMDDMGHDAELCVQVKESSGCVFDVPVEHIAPVVLVPFIVDPKNVDVRQASRVALIVSLGDSG